MLCVHDFQLLIDPLEDMIITLKPPSFNYCCVFFLRASITFAHSSGRGKPQDKRGVNVEQIICRADYKYLENCGIYSFTPRQAAGSIFVLHRSG